MGNKSMIETAYDIVSSKKRAIAFSKLWEDVSKQTGANEDMIAQLYSDLTLDGRFVQLKDNKWDLKARRKFSESHIDLSEIELEEDEPEEEYEEEENDSPVKTDEEY